MKPIPYSNRNNGENARVSWPLLLVMLALVGLPFGIGFFIVASHGATSVQIELPNLTNQPPTLKMVQPRWQHQATMLPDGRVLITGGYKSAPIAGIGDPEPADVN